MPNPKLPPAIVLHRALVDMTAQALVNEVVLAREWTDEVGRAVVALEAESCGLADAYLREIVRVLAQAGPAGPGAGRA